MTDRPAHPLSRHDGFHYEAVVDEGWIVPPIGAGRCRGSAGQGHLACQRAAVATLMRGSKAQPWDYCERHLYGRWIERGRVMYWRLAPDAERAQKGTG